MDDLLDLDWGKKSPNAKQTAPSSSYAFDSLTRAQPSSTQQRLSPNILQPQRSTTPQQQAAKPAASSRDAFSGLFDLGNGSASSPSGSSSPSTLSLAQQQLKAAPAPSSRPDAGWSSSSAGWDAFEQASSKKPESKAPGKEDDFLAGFSPAKVTKPSKPQSQPAQPRDPFDFSDFEDPGDQQTSAFDSAPARSHRNGQTASKAAVDHDDDDDFLGALGRPVAKPAAQPKQPAPAPSRLKRAASPPLHLVGQIVEMGFSPQEARQALAQTQDGLDVQAALESLLGSRQKHDVDGDEQLARRLQNQEGRDTEMDEYEAKERRRREARRGRREAPPEDRSSSNQTDGTDWQKQADQLYAQASELGANVFSRANAFWSQAKAQAQKTLEERSAAAAGSSAAGSGRGTPEGRASPAAWARKLGGAGPSTGGTSSSSGKKEWTAASGKPKWMVEAEEQEARGGADESQDAPQPSSSGAFKDSDTEDDPAPSFIPRATPAARQKAATPKAAPVVDDLPPSARFKAAAPEAASSASKGYASSARWGRSKPSTPSISPSPTPAPAPVAAPVQRRARHLCASDTQGYPSAALTLKTKGNDAFKLGSYGEAEAQYTSALDALGAEAESLRRIPLLNNRAQARLKNGDASAAARDCTQVLELVVGRDGGKGQQHFLPSHEAPLPPPLAGEVNLRDSYGKALLRRAQAYEMLERYLPAYKDWELLQRYEKSEGSGAANGVKNLRAAQEGVKRVEGAMRKDKKQPAPKPAATPARTSAAAIRAGEAGRQRVRAANAAAAAEESAAHALKDSIDSRISAWTSGGKANNIRALLSSLETVVPPEVGWKKVGMHEVLTEPQVKKVYTKAIARLHPDKLTPGRASLEMRLVGKEVFSVLNEAYAAHLNGGK
ncbi:hypothetical protein BDZ90DRAFT_233171 [Jaminaea rosea]|uniref:UBA domain-containing protein n=1 Tax=Jaminaea rosea TaxID=1569628 RepID=A0A316UTZ6_9BASI|nr:hypothetical protein BDZ90DRAFT_233171 [Jaminaea rosea]PWN26565.1 hypothetical protein BDZ90DRAFT_233171 [Jaminaea rosea]